MREATTGTAAAARGRHFRWPLRRLSIEDRHSAMDHLMVAPSGTAVWRFAVLMFLSSMVAAVGLVQNSVAVVIGAMMIAPLMAPIMGIAACLIMGWGRRLLTGLLLVSLSALGAVAVGWLFATLLAGAATEVPSQVIGRSSPDIRDLLVALGAGAAGAYATVHKKISGALPGVAVAVALVPPLAAIGVLLGYGQPQLARGATLLFLTNLIGIVLMAAVVFLLTGFVPRHRFRTHRRWIVGSVVITAMCTLAVTLILTPRFIELSGRAHDLKVATQTITGLLGPGSRLSHTTISGGTVRADVTGETAPPPVGDVAAALTRALGYPVTVQLGWIPMQDPEHIEKEAPQLPLSDLSPVVEKWLVTQSLTLQGLSYQSGTLVISTAGPVPPKSSEDLTSLISAKFKQDIPVSLAWTYTPGSAEPDDIETALVAARETTAAWSTTEPDTEVLSISGGGAANEITVTLIGSGEPDVSTLQDELRTNLPQATITIQWVSGGLLISDSPETNTGTRLAGSNPEPDPGARPGPPR
ncbi:MAG: DUF389 domain-containing protein [Actinomycetia bacterium]|nr:DUF389 domain-containing protein [Actinomycetes bacterium]